MNANPVAEYFTYLHFRTKTFGIKEPAEWSGFWRGLTKSIAPKLAFLMLLGTNGPSLLQLPQVSLALPKVGSNSQMATIQSVEAPRYLHPTAMPTAAPTLTPIPAPDPVQEAADHTSLKNFVSLIMPIEGVITTYYSSYHPGVDIAKRSGEPIKPIMGGKVITAQWETGYGQTVIIDHANGFNSRYAHLSKISVKIGDIIYQDTTLGYVGSTGNSTGSHLHLEIYQNGRTINPLQIIKETNQQRF